MLSIERSLKEILEEKEYKTSDLFEFNELYGSWNHHTQFSHTSPDKAAELINTSYKNSLKFLKTCSHCFITLGSSYSYFHVEENKWVANCHKVPQTNFRKTLLSITEIITSLKEIRSTLKKMNPQTEISLTISPVRHLRDGIIENNRSKARLIEAINNFTQEFPDIYYFPSFEIVLDVLRDYRFFDLDFAHPNYLGTNIVFEYFKDLCIDPKCYKNMASFFSLHLAMNHRSKHPSTKEHLNFIYTNLTHVQDLAKNYSSLDFSRELAYFQEEYDKLKN